jgi:parallel beta-helix repeat protein
MIQSGNMKKSILFLILLLRFSSVHSAHYYISSSSGSDANDGKTEKTPWKTIRKLNSAIQFLLPGDQILFQCNDTFSGPIFISQSASSGSRIYFGSYGSGSKPVLSGKTTVRNWNQTSSNTWSASCPECDAAVTNLFIDDTPQPIGRWPNSTDPNKGYRTFNSHSGKTRITDNSLSDAINWSGAEAVVRSVRWELNRLVIQSQNKGTLQFTSSRGFSFIDGFGYFIQNDPRTLDQQGEWYFNPANRGITIWSTTDPNSFETTTTNCDTLFNLNGANYITIENLHFDGAGMVAVRMGYCKNIIFRNNDITFSGINALEAHGSDFLTIENNLINKTNNDALFMSNTNHSIIRNNTIKNTALIAGMGLSEWHYLGAYVTGNDILFENNAIDSVGYNGMIFNGNSILIRNNSVSNFCMVKDDGGAIYTSGTDNKYSRKLIGNIVYNGIGAPEGSGWPGVAAQGIYMDEGASNVDILNNTIFHCSNSGIVIHNSNHIHVKGNTVYDNGTQLFMQHDAPERPLTNCVIDSNSFVSKLAVQEAVKMATTFNDIPDFGSFDYNYYCRPIGDDLGFWLSYYINEVPFEEPHSLSSWRLKYHQDSHSGESPISVNAYAVHSVNSTNRITNGTFTSNIQGWSSWSPYGNNKLSFDPRGGQTGGALHAEFTPSSGKADGYMFLISNNFALSTDKAYRLSFSARSDIAGNHLRVIPRKNDTPYNMIAEQRLFSIDTSFKQVEYVFTPYLNEPNARIDFQLSEGKGDFWFDNIELVEVDVTPANPDDYIRFEYNATTFDKTITVNDSYVDVRGMPVSGKLLLKPFTSIVLFKKPFSGLEPQSALTQFRYSLNQNYPNPFNHSTRIGYSIARADFVMVKVYDALGREVSTLVSEEKPPGHYEITFNGTSLSSGIYVCRMMAGHFIDIKKIVLLK